MADDFTKPYIGEYETGVPQVRLLATIPFGQFTANATLYKKYEGVLRRHAKQRTFILSNTMDQPIAANSVILPFDNTAIPNGGGVYGDSSTIASSLAAAGAMIVTSEARPQLSAHVNSLQFNLPVGATAPTTGDLKIYVVETF